MANPGFNIRLDRIASKVALDFLREFPELMDEMSEISLFRIANEVRNDAGENAPYLTGTLRRSLTTRNGEGAFLNQTKNHIETGTNPKYASSAEQMARDTSRRMFFKNAYLKQENGRGEEIFKEETDSIIK